MTDADLARWEVDAQYRAQDHADETIRERARTEALLALIAEVRRLRGEPRLEITVDEIQTALAGIAQAERTLEAFAVANDRLREMLGEIEWGGTIWTDTRVCLFCWGLHPENSPARDGRPEDRGHRPDCRWVAAVGEPQLPAPQVTATSITTQPHVGGCTETGVIITST